MRTAADTKRPSDSVPMASGQFNRLPLRFGRYQVEQLLGRGAMGAVYLARDTQLDRQVALKIPKVSGSGAAKLLARLKTEAKAAAQIDHPCLCHVYDTGEIDGISYIAMQYIEGKTLKQVLETDAKSPREAVDLVIHLAEGLAEAHARHIYHRDLKPENIKINRRGLPVIMDFGLAKLASTVTSDAGKTQSGTILGSPAYMSPEQAAGKVDEIDHRSDLYSLGVMLFEMLTGQWPFTGAALQVMGQKTILDPPSPLSIKPDLDLQLAGICHKLIAKNREDRYQSASELLAALQTLPAGNPRSAQESRSAAPDTGDPAIPNFKELDIDDSPARRLPPRRSGQRRKPVANPVAGLIEKLRGQIPLAGWIGIAVGVLLLGLWAVGLFTQPVATRDSSQGGSSSAEDVDEKPITDEVQSGSQESSPTNPPVAGKPVVPADAVPFGNKRYRLFAEHLNWHAARKKCQDLGGRLAEVRSQAENDFITNLATARNVDGVWLGATDEIEEGKWLWSDGSPLEYQNWDEHQPNNFGPAGEHYLMLLVSALKDRPKSRGMWWDQPTTSGLGLPPKWKAGFVCEWDDSDGTASQQPARPLNEVPVEPASQVLQGAWVAVGVEEVNGKPLPEITDKRFFFTDNKLTMTRKRNGEPGTYDGTYVINPESGHFDFTGTNPNGKPVTWRGIYKLDGDELQLCYKYVTDNSTPRPTEFRTDNLPGTPFVLVRLRRNAGALPAQPAPDLEGFQPLFNGHDLTGWTAPASARNDWRVVNGILTGSGPATSHLYSNRSDFTDFQLLVEARINSGGNSGVCFRVPDGPEQNPRFPKGYEAQINSTHKDPNKTGSLYLGQGEKPQSVLDMKVPPDEWFKMEIIARGPHLMIHVNGEQTVDFIDDRQRFTRGRLALQMHNAATKVEFRKIEIREADAPTVKPAAEGGGKSSEVGTRNGPRFPDLPKGAGGIDLDAPRKFQTSKTGLKYRVLRQGDPQARKATPADTVKVHYQGWLDDGSVFDSTYSQQKPATFKLSNVVKGWSEGMQFLGVGGMIELEIPPRLGYGDRGAGTAIPPHARLHFLIELLEIQ